MKLAPLLVLLALPMASAAEEWVFSLQERCVSTGKNLQMNCQTFPSATEFTLKRLGSQIYGRDIVSSPDKKLSFVDVEYPIVHEDASVLVVQARDAAPQTNFSGASTLHLYKSTSEFVWFQTVMNNATSSRTVVVESGVFRKAKP